MSSIMYVLVETEVKIFRQKKEWELFGQEAILAIILLQIECVAWCLNTEFRFLPWIFLAHLPGGCRAVGSWWGFSSHTSKEGKDRLWVTQPIPYPHSGLHFSEYMLISIFKRIFSKSDNLVKFSKGVLFPAFSHSTVINLYFCLAINVSPRNVQCIWRASGELGTDPFFKAGKSRQLN